MTSAEDIPSRETAEIVGELLALEGLGLAYKANAAFNDWQQARAKREKELDASRSELEPIDYTQHLAETLRPVTALSLAFADLSNAAGDLIGYETLGGEHLPDPVHDEGHPTA